MAVAAVAVQTLLRPLVEQVVVEILELHRRVLVLLALRILAAVAAVAQVVALTAAMAHKAAPVS
jgi:hypothetical protein